MIISALRGSNLGDIQHKGVTQRGVTYNETRPLGLATRAGVVKRAVEDIG